MTRVLDVYFRDTKAGGLGRLDDGLLTFAYGGAYLLDQRSRAISFSMPLQEPFGKQKLLGISKRGNRDVRKLLVHGARSCFRHLDRTEDRLGSWLDGLQARMQPNKAVVALAAKMARIVWVVLTKPGALYERRDPAFT